MIDKHVVGVGLTNPISINVHVCKSLGSNKRHCEMTRPLPLSKYTHPTCTHRTALSNAVYTTLQSEIWAGHGRLYEGTAPLNCNGARLATANSSANFHAKFCILVHFG